MINEQKFIEELRELTNDAHYVDQQKKVLARMPVWERTGLLEGYTLQQKIQLVSLLDNQALKVKETLKESTDTTDIAGFNKIAFPLVKKVFDRLIAQDIVSFQTMNLPTGLVFYQDYQFESSTQPQFTQNSPIYQNLDTSVSGILGGRGAGLATGGMYELRNWYSKNIFSRTLAVTAVDADTILVPFASLTGNGAGCDNSYPIFISNYRLEFDSWSGTDAYFSIYNDGTSTSGTTASLTATAGGTGLTAAPIQYVSKTSVDYRGDFESVSAIPSLNMRIASIPVSAETRKLKTGWTQETAQDLMAYQGIDAEVELTATLSDVTSNEINNNILNDLLLASKMSGNKEFWSYKIGNYLDTSGSSITSYLNSGSGTTVFRGTQFEWNQTLIAKMLKASNTIYKKTFRGAANVAVVSPDVATVLETTQSWKSFDTGDNTFSAGIEKVGTIGNNRITIYKCAQFPTQKVLLAFKGSSWYETGYVYAPYVLVYMTPTVLDPNTFEPRKMLMTRDARQVVKPEYFANITVKDLDAL